MSGIHALHPQCKVLATALFVFAVVLTPREAWWAFAGHAVAILAVAASARISAAALVRRLRIELPFVAFALLMPFVATGRRVDVLGVPLAVSGLWGAWNILVKGTLGVAASGVLVATTAVPDLLVGLERLRVPRVFVAIAGSMVRSVEVVVDEARRMRIARISRGDDPRWLWQARGVATTAGALFVRSYERGERVHLAMQARGFDGRLPHLDEQRAPIDEWLVALTVPAAAAIVTALAWGSA